MSDDEILERRALATKNIIRVFAAPVKQNFALGSEEGVGRENQQEVARLGVEAQDELM